MFVNTGSLPHLLSPKDYYSTEALELERELVFQPAWTFAGLKSQVPSDGDRIGVTTPSGEVIVWNEGGTVRAFRNACLHRHAQLCGHERKCATSIKCQYHGWEYSSQGKLLKIPDAESFKGIQLDSRQLSQLHIEQLGDLLFINSSPKAPSLRAALGKLAEELDFFFGDHRVTYKRTATVQANWKCAVENAVESYHVPMVHPTTFKNFRPPELHDHRITEIYTFYRDLLPWETDVTGKFFSLFNRLLVSKPTGQRFTHLHIFPNLMFYYADFYSGFYTWSPHSEETCVFQGISLSPRQTRFGNASRPLQILFDFVFQRAADKVWREDLNFLPKIHAGLKTSQAPGVLSVREERVHAFQHFITQSLQASHPNSSASLTRQRL
jgi:choline monooxygenase